MNDKVVPCPNVGNHDPAIIDGSYYCWRCNGTGWITHEKPAQSPHRSMVLAALGGLILAAVVIVAFALGWVS